MRTQPRSWRYRMEAGTERIRGWRAGWSWSARVAVLVAMSFSGCGFFDGEGEKRRILDQLEHELTPMANGAEELAQKFTGAWVIGQAFLSDELQVEDPMSTIDNWGGFWHARWLTSWTRARELASLVEERLHMDLEPSDAEAHPLMAQARWATGLAELYVGMTFCSAVLDDKRLTDTQWLKGSVHSLTLAIEAARQADRPDYLNAARAARAQARMLLEDWDGAESDAMEVPAGFSYVSYHIEGDPNPVVWLGQERLAGFLHKWWPLVEESEDPGFMIDPWSGEEDPRIPVHYNGGTLADSDVPHYRPLKYDTPEDDIPIVHYDMAQLIIAEARAMRGDHSGATAVLNRLRSAVGLPPHEVPTTAETMEELILWERFAELHLEGQRLLDLHRKGLMEEVFEALDDPERPGVGRPSKWGDCR